MAQTDYDHLRGGDLFYRQGIYNEAETRYRKALEAKEKSTTQFNLGNSLYQQHRLDEAGKAYQQAIDQSADPGLKADAYYNLGNALYEQQKYKESIQAYRETLKLRPEDEAAKKNMMLAMRQMQQQQQQQKPQQDQNQEPPPQEPQQQQQQQQTPQTPSEKDNPPPQEEEQLSEEEARDILKAIEREDQRVQEKLKKAEGKKAPPVKDW
jgi:tetratricopeptide (TPR) repeat protein